MSAKPLIRLEAARRDELDAVAYYAQEAGLDMAMRFADAMRACYEAIADRPGTGSRFGELLGIEGLRVRKLGRFPFLAFYLEYEGHIAVWRVLHAQRDIPATLDENQRS